MEVLVVLFVLLGDDLRLGTSHVNVWVDIDTSGAATNSFAVLKLALVKTALVVKMADLLELREEAAASELRGEHHVVKLREAMVFGLGACASANAVGETVTVV